jgi:hypothetical protein
VKLLNYIYYCFYRFYLKTPLRSEADVWPTVFLALTLCIHALAIYFLVTLVAGVRMVAKAEIKTVGVVAMILLMVAFFWYYVLKENGTRVVRSFEKLGNEAKYWRLGAIMVVETACLPVGLPLLLILSQKLIGWPQHF